MKVKFLGAAGTVTGSSYILTSGSGTSILIDMGMFQGTQEIEKLNYLPYEYDCRMITDAVLTHAHLDHCGRLPVAVNKGFNGKIYMTPPTRDLTELSLLDSAQIAINDGKKILYDRGLAQRTIDRFKTVGYHEPFRAGDFKVTFRDAGHIVGSASLEIEDLQPDSEIRKIVFSGDLGNTPEDLVKPTEFFSEADAVVMESTYGDRLHPEEDAVTMLQEEINAIEWTDSTLLIPAFALERTQEILNMIMHLKRAGRVRQETPVYLDSPMAEKATMIYLSHLDMLNEHIHRDLEETGSPFGFPGLEVVHKRGHSMALHKHSGAKVIIAGSGMMTGGRIVSHAAFYLRDPNTRLMIVGYQGEGTLGRQLMEGAKEVVIENEVVSVRATITVTHALSSHADQDALLDWVGHIRGVRKLFLTHGEDSSRTALQQRIIKDLGISDVTLPVLNQEVTL
ncbi:MAG: MBL fold metallo-hydrolase [Patescibacteria group bacterium]|nr:MBL fold metallo-hydrolase [Patescibacteria group bacterium]